MDLEEQGSSNHMEIDENPANPESIETITAMMNNFSIKEISALSVQQIRDLSSATQRTHEQCQQVINKGGIAFFIKLLHSQNQQILEQGFHALGNIAIDSPINRLQITNQGGLKKLVAATSSIKDNLELYEVGIWAISMVCRDISQSEIQFSQVSQAIQFMSHSISQQIIQDEKTLAYSLEAIRDCIGYETHSISVLIATNIVPRLFQLLKHTNLNIVVKSLAFMGNIAAGTDQQTDFLIKNGIIEKIYPFMSSPDQKIRKQVCWIYSNISAGTESQVYQLFSHQSLVENLLTLFENDNIQVGLEISYVFANMANHRDKFNIVEFFLNKSICSYYIKFLFKCQNQFDFDSMKICLQNLVSILQFGQKHQYSGKYSANPFVKQLLPFENSIQAFLLRINDQELQSKIRNLLRQFPNEKVQT